jgi:hypothetical protein
VIAVGDLPLEVTVRVTLRGRVRDLAVLLDALTSSETVVVFLAKGRRDDNEHEAVSDSREEFGCDAGERG